MSSTSLRASSFARPVLIAAQVLALLAWNLGAKANANLLPQGCTYNIKQESVVTHWPVLNATDGYQPVVWGATYSYVNNFLPNTNAYLADNHSYVNVPDATRDTAMWNMCNSAGGVPFSLYSWTPGVDTRVLAEQKAGAWTGVGTGRVRILQGIPLGGFVTIFLPPTWDASSADTYPIVAEAFYDVNDNVYTASTTGHAKLIATTVAESGLSGRKGAIGIVWNGGAALASATANAAAIQQFADIINWVSTYLRGERHNIYMIGRSRGGTAPLILASSGRTDFTIKHIVAMAFAPKFGSHISFMGATMPAQMSGLAGGTGFSKSWKPGFVYNGPAGSNISPKEAFSRIVVGDTLAALDSSYSLTSTAKLNNIATMAPKVILIMGSNDEWVQFGNEMEYMLQLRNRIQVEGHVVLRGGHLRDAGTMSGFVMPGVSDNIATRFKNAVLGAVASSTYVPAIQPGAIRYYNIAATGANPSPTGIVPISTLNESTEIPVSVELPFKTWLGMPYDIFVTAPTGTIVQFQTNLGNFDFTVGTNCNTSALVPGKVAEFCSFAPAGWPSQVVYYNVLVKTPSMSALTAVPWTLSGCNPAGTPLISTLGSYLPDVTAYDVWAGAYTVKQSAVCPAWAETNYGMVRTYP